MKLSEQLLRSYIRKLLIREKKWADFNAPKGKVIPILPDDFAVDAPPGVRDLDDEIFDQGRFGYRKINIKVKTHRKHRSYPINVTGDRLEGYATHYLEFSNFRIGQQISFDCMAKKQFLGMNTT